MEMLHRLLGTQPTHNQRQVSYSIYQRILYELNGEQWLTKLDL